MNSYDPCEPKPRAPPKTPLPPKKVNKHQTSCVFFSPAMNSIPNKNRECLLECWIDIIVSERSNHPHDAGWLGWKPWTFITARFEVNSHQKEKLGTLQRVPEIYTNIDHLYMDYIMVV